MQKKADGRRRTDNLTITSGVLRLLSYVSGEREKGLGDRGTEGIKARGLPTPCFIRPVISNVRLVPY